MCYLGKKSQATEGKKGQIQAQTQVELQPQPHPAHPPASQALSESFPTYTPFLLQLNGVAHVFHA